MTDLHDGNNPPPPSAINKALSNTSQQGGFVSRPADSREPEQRSTSPAAAKTSSADTEAEASMASGGIPEVKSTEAKPGAKAEQAAIEAIKAIEAGEGKGEHGGRAGAAESSFGGAEGEGDDKPGDGDAWLW